MKDYPNNLKGLGFAPAMANNFGHLTIDEDFEEALKKEPCYGNHFSVTFCGYVWFEDGQFYEAVYRYHSHIDTLSAPTLKELAEAVNEKYGSD